MNMPEKTTYPRTNDSIAEEAGLLNAVRTAARGDLEFERKLIKELAHSVPALAVRLRATLILPVEPETAPVPRQTGFRC